MDNFFKQFSLLLGVTGYSNEDLEFWFADLSFKKDLNSDKVYVDISLNSFKPFILTSDLIEERINLFLNSLKDKERLIFLDDLDCKPSELAYALSLKYEFCEHDNSFIPLFENPLYTDVLDIPDGDGGILEIVLEDQGSSSFIPNLSNVLIDLKLLNYLFDLKRDALLNNSLLISNSNFEFLKENLVLNEKNDSFYCIDIIREWLTDNVEDLIK